MAPRFTVAKKLSSFSRREHKRLHLERLPAYAPELNPDEGIWNYLKGVELKKVCCLDLVDLQEKLSAAANNLSAKPEIIKACFQQVGYY